MASDDRHEDLSTSICEAALSSFSESDDSLAGMIEQYAIEVRDFMFLSLLCDQESLDLDQLRRALGLDSQSIRQSIERLTNAGLVKRDGIDGGPEGVLDLRTTIAGRVLASRILDRMS